MPAALHGKGGPDIHGPEETVAGKFLRPCQRRSHGDAHGHLKEKAENHDRYEQSTGPLFEVVVELLEKRHTSSKE